MAASSMTETAKEPSERKPEWAEPRLKVVGSVGEILQDTGKGKCSIAGGDPGEGRKQSGGGDCG